MTKKNKRIFNKLFFIGLILSVILISYYSYNITLTSLKREGLTVKKPLLILIFFAIIIVLLGMYYVNQYFNKNNEEQKWDRNRNRNWDGNWDGDSFIDFDNFIEWMDKNDKRPNNYLINSWD